MKHGQRIMAWMMALGSAGLLLESTCSVRVPGLTVDIDDDQVYFDFPGGVVDINPDETVYWPAFNIDVDIDD